MDEQKQEKIEAFFKSELLQLNFEKLIIRKATKRFGITKDEAKDLIGGVKSKIRKDALNRAVIYLLLGGIALFVGIKGTLGDSGFILIGAILVGTGMLLSSLGLFRLYLTSPRPTTKSE